MGKARGTFKFVYVPAIPSEPLEEWELSYGDEEEAVRCLLDRLKVSRLLSRIIISLHTARTCARSGQCALPQ
jgi:hypothetical protein